MSQTRKRSLIESLANIAVGMTFAILLNYVVLWHQGYKVNWIDMSWLGLIMTIASFIRSFTLRRIFNWWDSHQVQQDKIRSGPLTIDFKAKKIFYDVSNGQ